LRDHKTGSGHNVLLVGGLLPRLLIYLV